MRIYVICGKRERRKYAGEWAQGGWWFVYHEENTRKQCMHTHTHSIGGDDFDDDDDENDDYRRKFSRRRRDRPSAVA